MKTTKIILSELIGQSHIRYEAVKVDGVIQLWDIYVNDKWIGSARLLRLAKQRGNNHVRD